MQIIIFSILAAGATILGGGIPLLHKKFSEKNLNLIVAFSAGILLSTGLNHMVIESFSEAGKFTMLAVSTGFLILYGYEKMAMVHACREHNCHVHSFGTSALVGMGFHSFLDGFAIAVSYKLEQTLGLVVVAAVILHRLPTGLSIACIMLSHNYTESRSWRVLTMIAALAIIGTVAGMLIPIIQHFYLSLAVGLSGGTFLYISTSDLLPMAHENNQDYKVPVFFFIGFLGVLLTSFWH